MRVAGTKKGAVTLMNLYRTALYLQIQRAILLKLDTFVSPNEGHLISK